MATHKDLVKLPVEQLGGRPLWALAIEMQLLAGGAALEQRCAARACCIVQLHRDNAYIVTTIAFSSCSSSSTPSAACWASCFV